MKKIGFFVIILLTSISLTGCFAKAENRSAMEYPAATMAPMMAPEPEMVYEEGIGYQDKDFTGGEAYPPSQPERMVIKNADLTIQVKDAATAISTIANMADIMGGFVVSSNTYMTTYDDNLRVPEGSITIRVPAERLTEAMDTIKALVENTEEDIVSESISGQDVTQEYTDMASRLRNLEQAEEQLIKFMDEAEDMEDVLSVYNQLVSVQEQIEVIKGQMQYYEQASSLSAINVYVRSKTLTAPLTIGGWQPVGVARNAIQALISTLKFLANLLIWIVLFMVPIALILYFPGWFIWKRIKRGREKRKAAKLQAKLDVTDRTEEIKQ